jgi:hypothetical protein
VRRSLDILLFLLFGIVPVPGHAGLVVSDETSGDFDAGQLFMPGAGTNLFSGTQLWGGDPVDGFRFVIPEGYRSTIAFSFTVTGLAAGEGAAWVWALSSLPVATGSIVDREFPYNCAAIPADGALITSQVFQEPEACVTPADWNYDPFNVVVLDAGAYLLTDNLRSSNAFGNPLFIWSASIERVAVPHPPAILLFGSALWVFFLILSPGAGRKSGFVNT